MSLFNCRYILPVTLFFSAPLLDHAAMAAPQDPLQKSFVAPPDSARPWVYWYFMDGNISKEGVVADLRAMKKAGIGGGIYLEVGIGVPRGPVAFMSPEWQDIFKTAVFESQRQGLQIALGTGPGWAGSGGPWVKPELSMQHMVASETTVAGPTTFDAVLPRPKPRVPFFGEGSMTTQGRRDWENYYQDEVVLAFPTPAAGGRIDDVERKALYYRAPYTSGTVPPRIPAPTKHSAVPANAEIDASKIVDLTGKLGPDGGLNWQVPAGNWTIMRFGRTTTGQTTRPAPDPGLGFEADKFSQKAVQEHLNAYTGVLLKTLGRNYRKGNTGLTMLHFDSWEMSSQNWTQGFKSEFQKRRGYDPTPFLPSMIGYVVETPERSERFLWDLRQTANELVLENHVQYLKRYAHDRGLSFSVEPYDMNPTADLDLGAIADLPMCEFWSRGYGFKSEYSCFEAVSAAHTNGRNVIGAEAFTSDSGDAWLQHPASMKNQLDWALCNGINKFVIHRYQHQPQPGQLPGMGMGPYGVHWEATQTWWDMVPAFHKYMARTSEMLRQGTPVNDILYLTPEGAPQVFTPPPSALTAGFPDKKGYGFDGCSPKTFLSNATVKNGMMVFPKGVTYKLLVLPSWETMTPQLLRKIVSFVEAGVTVVGAPPQKSPSLSGYPASDIEVKALAARLWGKAPYAASRKVGKGRVVYHVVDHVAKPANPKWIWTTGGQPTTSAPVGTVYFSKIIQLDPSKAVSSALAKFTADNVYELFINGKSVGGGDDFHRFDEIDVTSLLKPGSNEIRAIVTNEGTSPNPAGFLGSLIISYAGGSHQTFATDDSWLVARTKGATPEAVAVLGGPGMNPWGEIGGNQPSIYAPYGVTANALKGMGIVPDFSAGAPLRYIHRKLIDGDLYFIGNTSGKPISTTATFRTAGCQPEWWNAVTGESRPLPNFKMLKGLTSIPVLLDAYESGFVIFRKPAAKATSASNFPLYRSVKTLSQPWNVSFDPKWGAPAKITFARLEDWSKRPEPEIKYYSGKAVYRTSFDAPTGTASKGGSYALSLGIVKNMASVKLNGRDLGVVWCDPWRATVPAGLLKPTGNQLEVTVANLWVNRLIGDELLSENQRKTQTTHRPLRADSPLQPSGLLGPVVLQRKSGQREISR
jgi:hypothetical protein